MLIINLIYLLACIAVAGMCCAAFTTNIYEYREKHLNPWYWIEQGTMIGGMIFCVWQAFHVLKRGLF